MSKTKLKDNIWIEGFDITDLPEYFADDSVTCDYDEGIRVGRYQGYIQAHKDFMKDKLFTIEDIENAYIQGANDVSLGGNGILFREGFRKDYLKSLLTKTEWECTINNGKIELV